MTSILESISHLFSPIKPLPAGIYHYQAPQEDSRNYRLHLRIEEDGSGVLIINAATILHLNQTATEYSYYLVQNVPVEEVARKMSTRYHTDRAQARQDYQDLIDRIQTLINTPDLDPVTFLDFNRQTPFSGHISAPYRLDCAITYKLPDSKDLDSAPAERVSRELTTQEWKTIIDKAWEAGIPQIIFTGGEPTLREDLPELISSTEANGQVSGVLSDGLLLADKAYLDTLLQTGLDHLMIVLQPENQSSWAALESALAADLFVAVHLTITGQNQSQIQDLLDRLASLGVEAVSLSASDLATRQALQAARDHAASLKLELVWNLPVPYSSLNPVAMEIENHEAPDGAGRAWLYVEPDGDVLPGQGINHVLGNFLNDSWEKIWKG